MQHQTKWSHCSPSSPRAAPAKFFEFGVFSVVVFMVGWAYEWIVARLACTDVCLPLSVCLYVCLCVCVCVPRASDTQRGPLAASLARHCQRSARRRTRGLGIAVYISCLLPSTAQHSVAKNSSSARLARPATTAHLFAARQRALM